MVAVGCEELNSLLGDWSEDDIITQTDKRIKAVTDSGFYAVDSLPVELTWIPDSNPTRDSVLLEMNSEFHDLRAWNSGCHKQKFPGFRNRLLGWKQWLLKQP